MNTKPWSHLPNARLIDWVLQSVKDNLELWDSAWDEACGAAMDAAWEKAWIATENADRLAARDAALDAARHVTRDAAWDALVALVAYDDCDRYLQMNYEQLQVYAILSERPQAILLLPMKWVQEHKQGENHELLDTYRSSCV